MGALRDVVVDGRGAAPHLDDLAVVRERVFDGEEAADAGVRVDEFGEIGLLDGGGALPDLMMLRGRQRDTVIGC